MNIIIVFMLDLDKWPRWIKLIDIWPQGKRIQVTCFEQTSASFSS